MAMENELPAESSYARFASRPNATTPNSSSRKSERFKISSDVIREQLAILGAPVLELTAEERSSLFKEPVVLLTEPNTQSLVTVAVSKPTAEEGKAGKFLQEQLAATRFLKDVRDLIR